MNHQSELLACVLAGVLLAISDRAVASGIQLPSSSGVSVSGSARFAPDRACWRYSFNLR